MEVEEKTETVIKTSETKPNMDITSTGEKSNNTEDKNKLRRSKRRHKPVDIAERDLENFESKRKNRRVSQGKIKIEKRSKPKVPKLSKKDVYLKKYHKVVFENDNIGFENSLVMFYSQYAKSPLVTESDLENVYKKTIHEFKTKVKDALTEEQRVWVTEFINTKLEDNPRISIVSILKSLELFDFKVKDVFTRKSIENLHAHIKFTRRENRLTKTKIQDFIAQVVIQKPEVSISELKACFILQLPEFNFTSEANNSFIEKHLRIWKRKVQQSLSKGKDPNQLFKEKIIQRVKSYKKKSSVRNSSIKAIENVSGPVHDKVSRKVEREPLGIME